MLSANRDLNARWDAADDGAALREEVITFLLTTVDPQRRRLRQQLRAEMALTSLLACELGERIDQSLRPEKVYRHVLRPTEPTSGEEWDWPVDDEVVASQEENRIADYRVEKGGIPPDRVWAEKVIRLWSELALPDSWPPALYALSEGQNVEDAAGLARQLRGVALDTLTRHRDRRPVPCWVESEKECILIVRGEVARKVAPGWPEWTETVALTALLRMNWNISGEVSPDWLSSRIGTSTVCCVVPD